MADKDPARHRGRPFHHKLDHLLRNAVNPKTGRKYTLREVSAELSARLPPGNSGSTPQYLSKLRAGGAIPNLELVIALADIFEVKRAYFFDAQAEAEGDAGLEIKQRRQELQELKDALGDPNTAILAVHARGISPDNLGPVLAVLRTIRRLEGLADVGEEELQKPLEHGPEQS